MKKNWKIKNKNTEEKRLFPELEPAIERILLERGIDNEKDKNIFLCPDYENNLSNPFNLTDMKKAVERAKIALEKKETVCIYGDYDADGVTASCVLKDFFDQIGMKNFCYIPDRNKEGYGLNIRAIKYIKKTGANLIITVDCGISNAEEVAEFEKDKLDIIILDHHHIPSKIPQAVAVVNPKLDKQKASEYLAGVGVAFKFIQALASRIKGHDRSKLKWLLDLVAIGTIADCVPLLDENRILTKFGLIVVSKTKRVGLRQLFEVGRVNISENNLPTSHQIAFQVAPRINAAGRMDHANTAFKLLACGQEENAESRVLALELEDQNQRRQRITKQIVEEVKERIKNKKNQKIIIERSPYWELGVIGLAAGKICESYNCPTILLNQSENISRGSGRSIESFNLIETLEKYKDLMEKYGGHRQAAGLSIKNENYEEFKKNLTKEAEKNILDDLIKNIQIDVRIKLSEINNNLIKQLSLLEPFGQGNPQPVFIAEKIEVADKKLIGQNSKHLKIWFKDSDRSGVKKIFEAIAFNMGDRYNEIKIGAKISAVFNIEEDSWNGNKKVQFKIIDF